MKKRCFIAALLLLGLILAGVFVFRGKPATLAKDPKPEDPSVVELNPEAQKNANLTLVSVREQNRIVNEDEYTEVFELAAPQKDFELYSESHWRRMK